ncbi:MAG: LolA family protein [Limisphaerales bacterium]
MNTTFSWSSRAQVSESKSPLHWICLLLITLFCTTAFTSRAQDSSHPLISKWLAKQASLQTWSADFTQTRTLKAFAQPLVSDGQVWFAAPNRFRWELGNPPQTIAVRQPEQMLVFYPRLKRVEKYPLVGNEMGQWRDALSLLEAGFPRSRQELDEKFRIRSLDERNGAAEITLEPRAAGARRMMPQLRIAFAIKDFTLLATELHFADGSIMRNDFRNPVLNQPIDPATFSPSVPPEFKVIEPLKR